MASPSDFEIQFTKEEENNRERLCMENEGLRQLFANAESVLTFSASFYERVSRDKAVRIFRSFIHRISSRWRLNSQVAFILRITTRRSHLSDFNLRPHFDGVLLFKNNAVALPHITGSDQWMNYQRIASWWGAKPEPAEVLKEVGKDDDHCLTGIGQAVKINLEYEETIGKDKDLSASALHETKNFIRDRRRTLTTAYLDRRNELLMAHEEEVYRPSYNIGGCQCAPLNLNDEQALKAVIERIRPPKELKEGRPKWTAKGKTMYGGKPSEREYHLLISENLYCFIDGYEPRKHLQSSEVYRRAVEASESFGNALQDAREHISKPRRALDHITGDKYSYTVKSKEQRIKEVELIAKQKETIDNAIKRIKSKIRHQERVLKHIANPRLPWLHQPRSPSSELMQ